MVSSLPGLLLQKVVQLGDDLCATLVHADVLAASREAPTDALRLALAQAVTSIRDVHTHALLVYAMQSAETLEMALVARSAAVASQLAALRVAERELSSAARVIMAGEASVAQLAARVTERIGRINAMWLAERRTLMLHSNEIDGHARIAEHSLYQLSLHRAEYAFCAIGSEPVVRTFLLSAAAVDSSRFRDVCRVLSALLDAAIGAKASTIPGTT